MIPLAIILTVCVGLCLGLFGSGGSMLLVPILVYVARFPAHQAVVASLFIVGSTSLLGLLVNMWRGAVDLRLVGWFAAAGVATAPVGAAFTHLVRDRDLLVCFAVLMILIGLTMFARPAMYYQSSRRTPLRFLLVGAVVGLVTGFFGVGGGFIIVPALVLAGGLNITSAIGTSLGVIAVNCFAGLISQLAFVQLDLPLALGLAAAGSAGMLPGVWLADRLGPLGHRSLLAACIIALGGCVLVKNLLPL